MGIIVDIGKVRAKEILSASYFFAVSQTSQEKFGNDDQDAYPRGVDISFITKKEKLDWMILEEISQELPWFYTNKKAGRIGFKITDYGGRHDMEISFQSHIASKLSEFGLKCFSNVYYL